MNLGNLLKIFRCLRVIEREEFRIKSGFSQSYISAIENDKRKIISSNVLEKYAQICKVRPSVILRIQEDSERYSWDKRKTIQKAGEALYQNHD